MLLTLKYSKLKFKSHIPAKEHYTLLLFCRRMTKNGIVTNPLAYHVAALWMRKKVL